MRRKLLALGCTIFFFGCDSAPTLTSPREAAPPSFGIFDGAHSGGNPDFFFLPPMVPNPVNHPNFKAGEFNAQLRPRVTICQLDGSACGPNTVADFSPGQISLGTENYQVDWDTKASSLNTGELYRIQVFIGTMLLGFADVDPVANGKELRNVDTGEYIGLVDGRTLPIRFRVQNGALCEHGIDCTSVTVGTDGGVVLVPSGAAGAEFPAGWLPDGYTEVTVTIDRVPRANLPCHPSALPQFEGCYEYTTEPVITERFAKLVTAGVCLDPAALESPLYNSLQLHASNPDDDSAPIRALPNVIENFLTGCGEFAPQAMTASRLRLYAGAAGRALGRLFLPRVAHALDLGLGGLTDSFSDIGWMSTAELVATSLEPVVARPGQTLMDVASVRLLTGHHDGESTPSGLAGIEVTFSVGSSGGNIDGATSVSVATDALGMASVPWTLGGVTGLYSITAEVPGAQNSPIVITATAALPDLLVASGTPTLTPATVRPGDAVTLSPWSVRNVGPVGLEGGIRNGFYLSTDATITSNDLLLGQNNNTAGVLGPGQQFDWGGPTLTIPSTVAPGRYWIGILVDDLNQVVESDESNNFVSVPVCVATDIDFEHDPDCVRTVDREMITTQFQPLGLVASFRAVEIGGEPVTSITSLQLNRGVAIADVDPDNTSLTNPGTGTGGWFNGTLVLDFPANPATVSFIARYNASVPLVTIRAFGAEGGELEISPTRSSTTYFACEGCVEFREEIITFTYSFGIARIEIIASPAVVFVDDLRAQAGEVIQ